MEKKMSTSPEELCEGFPNQLIEYIKYTQNLKYEENPDYDYLKKLFVSILNSDGFEVDCYYDWDKETIKYIRDFKNDNNKNDNNENKYFISSLNTNEQLNSKDINIYCSNKSKKYISYNNYNTSNINVDNNNSISMANNMGNTTCGIYGSSFNIEGPNLKQNIQEIITENDNTNLENKENIFPQNNLEKNQQNNIDDNYIYNDNEQNKYGEMKMRFEKDNKCCLIF